MILAPILIGFGVAALLTLGAPIGPIIFAFGLMGVCVLSAQLFTGKAGYYWRTQKAELGKILIVNLVFGYLFGFLLSLTNKDLVLAAQEKVMVWDFSIGYFIKSIFCGMIMYMCVEMYRKGTFLGIIYGVPLFIFCGFQHCIANIIILGVGHTWSWTIVICIIGNFLGSVIIDLLNGK